MGNVGASGSRERSADEAIVRGGSKDCSTERDRRHGYREDRDEREAGNRLTDPADVIIADDAATAETTIATVIPVVIEAAAATKATDGGVMQAEAMTLRRPANV